jgi:hypothetical protein
LFESGSLWVWVVVRQSFYVHGELRAKQPVYVPGEGIIVRCTV